MLGRLKSQYEKAVEEIFGWLDNLEQTHLMKLLHIFTFPDTFPIGNSHFWSLLNHYKE